ncbi:N-chimaerin [Desmophyllum pertusum]|uniref:N-chimaerin n=1 Tax=Desmophyllum pertusum TaxID=174260 RepID=A0A9W9Z8G2_9CNID|nr:N-chimaerin [Desmophyllum pertusum]
MTEEPAEEGRFYDTIEQPVWKLYLYRLQQKAPKARKIVCTKEIPQKPTHYGKEFHGCISREEADDLVSEGDGSYLVRESQKSPGSYMYILTMRFGGVSKNFRLYYDGLHYVGEERFPTIQDLVADGLITMYIDTYAKDYVDTMMISPVKLEEKKDEGKAVNDETKENNEIAKDSLDASGKDQDQRVSIGRRESVKPFAYKKKHHNFKIYTFKGPHWCDFCRNFLWGLIMQGVKCQEDGDQALVLLSGALDALQLQTPSDVVARLQESLPLEQASLKQPDQETKRRIRYLCMKAKSTNRLDVVEKLREMTPAGTTGPLLSEALDVRNIPFRQRRDLTIDLLW